MKLSIIDVNVTDDENCSPWSFVCHFCGRRWPVRLSGGGGCGWAGRTLRIGSAAEAHRPYTNNWRPAADCAPLGSGKLTRQLGRWTTMSRTATASGGFRTDLATPAARPWPLILANRSRTSFFLSRKFSNKFHVLVSVHQSRTGHGFQRIFTRSKNVPKFFSDTNKIWDAGPSGRVAGRAVVTALGLAPHFRPPFWLPIEDYGKASPEWAAHIVSHSALAADWRNKFQCAERVATLSRKLTDKLNSLSHENIHRNSWKNYQKES